jgi:hypothetical protein
MKKNMGSADRIIRLIIAAAATVLYGFNIVTGTAALVLVAISAIFVLTSFASFCPIYRIAGVNSCGE